MILKCFSTSSWRSSDWFSFRQWAYAADRIDREDPYQTI